MSSAASQPPPLPAARPARNSWTFGGSVAVFLLALLTAGVAFMAAATFHAAPPNLHQTAKAQAGLLVQATDGTDVSLWVEREGQPGRALPRECELPPGNVAIRVTRRVGQDRVRSDIVRMELRPGCRHLVTVGDAPVKAFAYTRSYRRDLDCRFPAPGVICFDEIARNLRSLGTLSDHDAPLDPRHELNFEDAAATITSKDHVLLICNPYPEVIDVRVTAPDWEREFSLGGPVCRVVGAGEARQLKVVARRTTDQQPIEQLTIELPQGLPIYTIGGRTVYRWTATGPEVPQAPAVPRNKVAILPADCTVRLASDPVSERKLLTIEDWHGADLGLTPVVSAPLSVAQAPSGGEVTVRRDFRLTRLDVPGADAATPIDSIATNSSSIIAIVGGRAVDVATGKPLHDPADSPVVAGAWGRFGLVLLTADGTLATVHDRKLQPIKTILDPTVQLLASTADEPSVWLFGGSLEDQVRSVPLAAGPGPLYALTGVTAMAQVDQDLLIAQGRRIDRASLSADRIRWMLRPVVILPEADGQPIVGVADVGGQLFFSTADSVSTIQGGLVLPVISGVGGRLFNYGDGLLVHDAATHRIFEISPVPSTNGEARP